MALSHDALDDTVSHAFELFRRYESDGIAAHIEEAIRIHRQVLDQRGEGHPRRDESLSDLAECYRAKFQRLGDTADLIEATSLFHSALQLRPVGHSRRLWTLYKLATCFRRKFASQRIEADLQQAIFYYQEASELCPAEHLYRAIILDELAGCLQWRFRLLDTNTDVDKAIALHNTASRLRPEGHPDRHISLDNLAIAFEAKSMSQGSAAHLDDAISLHHAALELRPIGSPFRPLSLISLAGCLQRRFKLQGVAADLNGLIDVLWTLRGSHALARRSHCHLSSTLASSLEARYYRLRQLPDLEEAMKIRQELPDPSISCHPHQDASHLSCILQVATSVIQDIQESLPPRLLDTQNGTICDRAMQISKFENSSQYLELLSSARIHRAMQHRDLESIRKEVSRYFRYATLSHRWGNDEPLLEDIAGHSTYDMLTAQAPNMNPSLKIGLMKLQNFCRIAKEHGFHWAWSDTCCLDKNNIIEIQEAFGFMFSWYRQSGLTLVHLADVHPNATARELSGSEWFRRGWTLQELLAPQAILFYSQDWTLLVPHESFNHKRDNGMLTELERATGIPRRYLTNFSPGMDDARLRLQWASCRRTTRLQDRAYSLFGIFNVHLPPFYGEPKEKAFGRLLQEIITRSGDTSVLDWSGRPSSYNSCFPASIESYRSAPSVQPRLHGVVLEQSLSRLRDLVHPEDAHRFYTALTSLPFPHFTGCRLRLPCIFHRVQSIQFKEMDSCDYLYEVQASNLRPLVVASLDRLTRSSQAKRTLYVLVRVLDQKLLESLEEYDDGRNENSLGAAYRVMAELDRPFSALLLQVHRRAYRRVASSHTITPSIQSIAASELTIVDVL